MGGATRALLFLNSGGVTRAPRFSFICFGGVTRALISSFFGILEVFNRDERLFGVSSSVFDPLWGVGGLAQPSSVEHLLGNRGVGAGYTGSLSKKRVAFNQLLHLVTLHKDLIVPRFSSGLGRTHTRRCVRRSNHRRLFLLGKAYTNLRSYTGEATAYRVSRQAMNRKQIIIIGQKCAERAE
jgi:hypothetical protein